MSQKSLLRVALVSMGIALGAAVGCAKGVTDDTGAGTPDSGHGDSATQDAPTSDGQHDADSGHVDAGADVVEDTSNEDTGTADVVFDVVSEPDATADAAPDGGADVIFLDSAGDVQDAQSEPDAIVCGASTKLCGSQCVALDDPLFGCDPLACVPCAAYAHAAANCSAGGCALGACSTGYLSCDGNDANGCETNVNNNAFACGYCGNVCSFPNAGSACASGVCSLGACASNYFNCDGDPVNGCEVNLATDPNNCGGCNTVCPAGGGTAVCTNKICSVSSCSAGTADCDLDPLHTCETDTQTSRTNCGVCGNVCNLPNATSTCQAGQCKVATCKSGYDNCDLVDLNGCEAPLNTTTNCGTCGVSCSPANATGSCSSGICVLSSCNTGYEDCSGGAADGCEVDTRADPNHCGDCSTVCNSTNGVAYCAPGGCGITCTAGFANCDALSSNGCEATPATDPNNCGSCGAKCASLNSTGNCVSSTCQETCFPGYDNCDGLGSNGCESPTSADPNNCGTCSNVCPTPANAMHTCSSSTCGYTCAGGYGDCDGNAGNGCESVFASDANHCGNCSKACSAGETCSGGVCNGVVSCGSGKYDCNSLSADGCECTAGSGCCGSSCQTAHNNGLGQSWGSSFYDCETTYTQQLGMDACAAFTGNVGQCALASCTGPGSNKVVCSTGASRCICWTYAGSNAGKGYSSATTACNCGANITWN